MVRFPHSLYYTKSSESFQDNSGDFVSSDNDNETFVSECRTEPNGSGALIKLSDGSTYQYSSMIYLPAICNTLKQGDVIAVKQNGTLLYSSQIVRISNDQKHVRIWV